MVLASIVQISDHPSATNGSTHSITVTALIDGTEKSSTFTIGVERNATKLDRQTYTRAFLDFNTTQTNSTEVIFEKG